MGFSRLDYMEVLFLVGGINSEIGVDRDNKLFVMVYFVFPLNNDMLWGKKKNLAHDYNHFKGKTTLFFSAWCLAM